ncbi:unnamed protein product, partial [Rotaria sordida]
GKHEEFSLAFAGTTVHDMFNWLKVLISIANIRFSLKRKQQIKELSLDNVFL